MESKDSEMYNGFFISVLPCFKFYTNLFFSLNAAEYLHIFIILEYVQKYRVPLKSREERAIRGAILQFELSNIENGECSHVLTLEHR